MRKKLTEEESLRLAAAIAECSRRQQADIAFSVRSVAKEYQLARTTLRGYLAKVGDGKDTVISSGGAPRALSPTQEALLVKWVANASSFGEPMFPQELQDAALGLARNMNDDYDFKASNHWLASFMERNNIVVKESKHLAVNRQMGLKRSTVDAWFEVLDLQSSEHDDEVKKYFQTLTADEKKETPLLTLLEKSRVNLDETVFSNGKKGKAPRVAVPKGASGRSTRTVADNGSHFVAVLEAIDASGECVGSFTFFDSKRLHQRHIDAVDLSKPPDAKWEPAIIYTETGANNRDAYVDAIVNLLANLPIRMNRPNLPLFLIHDGASMHKGDVVTEAVHQAGRCRLLVHVPYTSLWAQVLDSYPFAEIKKRWYALLRKRARQKKRWRDRTEMLTAVHTILGQARQDTEKRKLGWRETGAYPTSKEAMLKSVAKFLEAPPEENEVEPIVVPLARGGALVTGPPNCQVERGSRGGC